ncbi:MAG: PhnD/SsuA/transferrin family substrate-binding protein [Campylobacterota bacterium]|nr:PhnD/SsuA/transferrin family substrate-binding protein [Campylobacterota bacterium]
MILQKLFLLFLLLFSHLHSQEIKERKIVTFAPLLTSKKSEILKEFLPLFNYIEKSTGVKTKFLFEKDYSKLIEKFKQNKIDILLLGPLPYVKLNQINKFNMPIIGFKQKDGNPYYRCVLAKFAKDKISFNDRLKVAPTQPLSTCGYYMTNILLKEKFNLSLKNQEYNYTMSHYNAIIGVLDGDYDVAGVKDSTADDFRTLGVRAVAKSGYLPGFSLIVNTRTLPKYQIKTLQNAILSIKESTYKEWQGISSNGFVKANKNMYENLEVNFKTIPNRGNMK